MAQKRKKRPRDPIQLAKLIGDIATGQTDDCESGVAETASSKLKQLGGIKGGRSRAEKLTPEQKSDIARIAATARWKKR